MLHLESFGMGSPVEDEILEQLECLATKAEDEGDLEFEPQVSSHRASPSLTHFQDFSGAKS